MDLQLMGKRALVTGGSQGIGKAIARQLAREGVDCAICSRTEASILATAAELAKETGQRIFPFAADMAQADDITRLVKQAAEALGGIDILINNGARGSGGVPAALAPGRAMPPWSTSPKRSLASWEPRESTSTPSIRPLLSLRRSKNAWQPERRRKG